jgi:hypothetical protein
MKKVILLLLFRPCPLFCQIKDNFETGTLNNWIQNINGRWKADTSAPISGKFSLHHIYDNPDAGFDQTGIRTTNLNPSMGNTKWSFKVRYNYDPSSSNNWSVFILSDNEPTAMFPGGSVNGFAIGVNLTGYDDTLRLWKIKEGLSSVVLNTGINWQNDIGVNMIAKIDVDRSQEGEWNVAVNSHGGSFIRVASASDKELFNADWFGLYYKYSSTRDRLLWFDDLSIDGIFYKDSEAPEVVNNIVRNRNSVVITLNEEPDNKFMTGSNFLLNGIADNKSHIIKISPLIYQIEFDNQFINKSLNSLIIKSLCDKSANCSNNVAITFSPVWVEKGDIVISEIMADPVPSVSLPEKEYIELTNRTDYQFNLKKWQLTSEGQNAIFPETVINPHEHKIICPIQDTSLFINYGKVTGLKSFPTLNDAGKLLIVTDSSLSMIHGVEYSNSWYGDKLKAEGGWSLEMIDTDFPFYQSGNWSASVSRKGGTPGQGNSVSRTNPDDSFAGIINAFPEDSVSVIVTFSETAENIDKAQGDILIDEKNIQSVISADPLQRKYIIKPGSPLLASQLKKITFPDMITDFAGNKMLVKSFVFGLPESASKAEIVFNELLFNPLPGDADYIELFNLSDKVINASELYLVSVNDETGDTSELVPVSAIDRCFLPLSHYTITSDRASVLNRYPSAVPVNIFQTDKLPSMSDNKGHLILLNRNLDMIDEVNYDENMHYSLLSGYEGIALEKVRPDGMNSDLKNWHSASEVSGWGTPGAQNSVYSEKPVQDENVVLSSRRITPDNDGNEDVLVIDLNLKGSGNIVTVMVFDETGNYVCKPANNLLAGTRTSLVWDGTGEDGTLVNTGIYIIFVSVYDDTGKTIKWKKVCAVIR